MTSDGNVRVQRLWVIVIVTGCLILDGCAHEISKRSEEESTGLGEAGTGPQEGGGSESGTSGNQGNHVVNNNGVPHSYKDNGVKMNPHQTHHEEEIIDEERKKEIKKVIADIRKSNPDAPPPDPNMDLESVSVNEIVSDELSQRKRFVEGSSTKRWTNGVVPYIFTDLTDAAGQFEIKVAMKRIEKYTCIRFPPYEVNDTREEYGLDHDGHLRFTTGNGCWAVQGNARNKNGQKISCCGRGTCTHELGHALGVWHEHQSPQRNGWIRVNNQFIEKDSWKWYRGVDPAGVIAYGYDLSSIMHYAAWAFNANNGRTMTLLYPELSLASNFYYMFYEVVSSHNCKGLNCSSFATECENDGYVTLIEGQCSCMCPYGLDRSSGCTSTITQETSGSSWPKGSYSLISSEEGCPDSAFTEGNVVHWGSGSASKSTLFHLKGSYDADKSNPHFCTMNNNGGTFEWPSGRYCINRAGGSCPEGFLEGSVLFNDETTSPDKNNSKSGTLPDGTFGVNTTLFLYCCRDDGFESEPMDLPNQKEFILYRHKSACQHVKGMFYTNEYYKLNSARGVVSTGAAPYIRNSWSNYYMYFCYYKPYNYNCGEMITLDAANPTATIKTPNYPSNYDANSQCNWFIKAPKGTSVLLNFADFDVEKSGTSCVDTLEIRHARVGQPGITYCGLGMDESIRSITSMMSLTLRSGLTVTKKGFQATVSYIDPAEHCYDVTDAGATYRGPVNYTRHSQPCIPWAEASSCPFNPFDQRYVAAGLDGNYCRNPGNGHRPWCYTQTGTNKGCLRDYCDVCMKENIYDNWDDCSDVIALDSDFCTTDPRAFKGCAKTCASAFPTISTPPKAKDITCDPPTLPADSVLVSESKTSYKVGDTIELRCNTSTDKIIGSCLTDGSWTVGNYTCGTCPTGWAYHEGNCYKYFQEKLNYNDATARCVQFGAILAPTKTSDELAYVVSLRTFARLIWFGADDKETEGTWKWQDGTVVDWSNWKSGQPDNWNNEDCAVIREEDQDNQWSDNYCTWYNYHHFVCKKSPSARTECKDRADDCLDIFYDNPKSCKNFPDWAAHECSYTCGVCTEAQATVCNLPVANDNVNVVSNTATGNMNRGDYITYACADGYTLTSGNLERGCQWCAELTGDPPVCKDINTIPTPNNDVALITRSSVGWFGWTFTGNGTLLITKSGEIVEWQFFARTAGAIALQVYSLVEGTKFQLKGQNAITTAANRVNYVKINADERIAVSSGDMIGVYLSWSPKAGELPFDSCSDSNVVTYRSEGSFWSKNSFTVGNTYEFRASTAGCRIFSVTAVVGPVATNATSTG